MVQPGLDDGRPDSLKVIEIPEEGRSAQAVEPQLGVVLSLHSDPFAILQVDDLDRAAADDDGVRGPEALRHPAGQAELLLDHELRVLACRCQMFLDGFSVEIGGLVHLAAVVFTGLDLSQLLVVVVRVAEELPELQLGECVGQCPFVRVGARSGGRELVGQCNGSGAVDPPEGARCGQFCMFTRH